MTATDSATRTAPRSSGFLRAARITFLLVYAVILAGGIVRATGSGMGCPDWPKCFGHYIPPSDISELQYREGMTFKEGHFIIHDNALWKAKRDLVATASVDLNDWEKYTKHDYARFNAAHTWTEYVNRLSGALLGIAAMVMVVIGMRSQWRRDRALVIGAVAALLMIGFEGWLGALVVESNLDVMKITIHMVVAFLIVAMMTWVVKRAERGHGTPFAPMSSVTARLLWLSLVLTMAQTVFGTQVREQVDLIAATMGESTRAAWVDQLGEWFEIHRSFAWLLLGVNGWAVMRMLKEGRGAPRLQRRAVALSAILLASVGSGIILSRMGLPAVLQPAHLFLAALLFGLQFSMIVEGRMRSASKSPAVEPVPADAVAA